MNEETLHNFPSYLEQTQTLIQELPRENPVPVRLVDPEVSIKMCSLFAMVDGKLPERQKITNTSNVTASRPASVGFLIAVKEAFNFLNARPSVHPIIL